jgi:iron complex outermembrane receptor protein
MIKKIQILSILTFLACNIIAQASDSITFKKNLDEVSVNALRANDKTPMAFTNISKSEIKKSNLGQDLTYLISLTPSVVTTSDAGAGIGYTGLRIRGTDPSRINVTINGIPVNDSESQGVWWVNMPDFASSLDNIQIQRGVGTSTNGAAAFGASINLKTLALNKKAYTITNNSVGSFNTLKNNIEFGSGMLNNKFTFDGRLSRISSDGYIDRATSDLKSLYLQGAYFGKKSVLKAIVFSGQERTYQAWNGVPKRYLDTNRTFNSYTYENEVDNYNQTNYQLH